MIEQEDSERYIRELVEQYEYPPTPDFTDRVLLVRPVHRARIRRVIAATIIAVIAIGLITAPDARAALLSVLRLGRITIILEQQTVASPTSNVTQNPALMQVTPRTTLPSMLDSTATPVSVYMPTAQSQIPSRYGLDRVEGETGLDQAQELVSFRISIPRYPPAIGLPDRTFVLEENGFEVVLLAWTVQDEPNKAWLTLHILGGATTGIKTFTSNVQATTVNGHEALWIEGEHLLMIGNQPMEIQAWLVNSHVLIWAEDDLTYRLETDLQLQEARLIAESIEFLGESK